jgi:formate hydrogenlyase subunit 4
MSVRAMSYCLPVAGWVLSPLMLGIINRVKAVFAGRKGAPLLQPYYDLFKLLRKASVYSRSTSAIIRFGPSVVLACLLLATLFLPWGTTAAPIHFTGDVIILIYLLGLARFVTVLAALDTGSSFEGMGASREVQFGALSEPSLFLGLVVLVLHCGFAGLSDIVSAITPQLWHSSGVLLVLVMCSWFVILLSENCRIPMDDPNTHLELTMIHEVMVLDYSGPDLAYVLYAASLKLWLFAALVANLIVPAVAPDSWLQVPLFLVAMVLVAILVGVVESTLARLRLLQVPKVLIGAATLSAVALIVKVAG